MKKILFVILMCMALPILAKGQVPSDAVFKKYTGKEGVEITAISGFMLKPFLENFTVSLKSDEQKEIGKYLATITSVAIIQPSENKSAMVKNLLADANLLVKSEKYTQLMSQTSNGVTFKIVSHKNKDTITELLGFGSNTSGEAMLISIQGKFTETMIKDVMAKVK